MLAGHDVAVEHRATFELVPEAASKARAVINDELGPSVSDKVLDDATLLVSELVTNAVRHAPRAGFPEVELRLKVDAERVRVVVSDPGGRLRRGASVSPRLRRAPAGVSTSSTGSPIGGGSSRTIATRSGSRSTWTAERWASLPSPPRGRRSPGTARPGPLAPWIWNERWIPGFVVAQVAVLLLFADKAPGSYEGVPGGLGALLSVTAAIVCGPIARERWSASSAAWSSYRSSPTSDGAPSSRSSSG